MIILDSIDVNHEQFFKHRRLKIFEMIISQFLYLFVQLTSSRILNFLIMKPFVIIASFLFVFALGCTKDDPVYYGQITGVDYSLCVCCGGWFIDIENETYRFYHLPENNNIDLSEEIMLVDVILEWEKDENGCLGDEIIISSIALR